MIPRILWMLNRFAVEIHTLPVHLGFSLNILHFEGMLRPLYSSQRQDEEPPNIWDTSGISGNVFANPQASSSAPYSQELNSSKWNPWRETTEEQIHKSIAEKSGRPKQDSDLRCQSGPSAKNSVLFSGGDSSKNYGADQQRLQISDLHFDKFPTPATFSCWKIRFKTEVCTCSQFPTEAMQWIKEVELADSVDELRSSSSIRSIPMPDFEVLDARIASALNKIIHNSHFKRKISLEEQKAQKEDRFLRGRQIAYLIYEQFRVTGTDSSVETYTDLFTIAVRNGDIQEFDSKWDGILLSMTKIPPDDILEGLYKLRIRESDKLKTVLELYDLETHQKKLGPTRRNPKEGRPQENPALQRKRRTRAKAGAPGRRLFRRPVDASRLRDLQTGFRPVQIRFRKSGQQDADRRDRPRRSARQAGRLIRSLQVRITPAILLTE